jgi:hypothetical protein
MLPTLVLFAAVDPHDCSPKSFFGLPSLYKYMHATFNSKVGVCELDLSFYDKSGNLDLSTVSLLGLGLLDILLRVAALVTVGFIIYGGILYVTSQGEPDKAKHALSTIINAAVGLVITIISAAIVSFIGTRLAGGAGTNTFGLPEVAAGQSQIQVILTIFFGILSAASLLIIMLAGFRYVTSSGDPGNMAKAKNTIIYAAIGLVVSMSAFAIVAFLLNSV